MIATRAADPFQEGQYGPVTGLSDANCDIRQDANGTWSWCIDGFSSSGHTDLRAALWDALKHTARERASYKRKALGP